MATKNLRAVFVGSFYRPDQMPRDRRPQIAVAGRSNVGKSSLLNQVVGQKRLAKVSATPGRTRSVNFFLVNDRYYLVDLPGYGYAKINKALRTQLSDLIREYLTADGALAGLVLLLDCRRDLSDQDRQILEWLARRELPVLVALTKADKISRSRLMLKVAQTEAELGAEVIPFSIVTGIGKRELEAAMADLVAQTRSNQKA